MRVARLQTNDLGRADNFFGSLLSKENIKETDKPSITELPKGHQVNGTSSVSFQANTKPRFSDPPAPPPQQPLPEKPDVARLHTPDTSLKRSNTERPRSVPNTSPIRQEPTSQIITLVEALAAAKKEIDTQSARVRDLEEMLQKEREAREVAEEVAKRLESESRAKRDNHVNVHVGGSVIEEAFEPPIESSDMQVETADQKIEPTNETLTKAISDSTSSLEKRLEAMLLEMQTLQTQMDLFKSRAETAETERDADRKTLAQMVEKLREEEVARRASSAAKERSPQSAAQVASQPDEAPSEVDRKGVGPMSKKSNGIARIAPSPMEVGPSITTQVGTLPRPPGNYPTLLYHGAPYASMLGVVLIGMGVMAYLNGWQPPSKGER